MTDRDHFAAAALTGLLGASDANSWADDLWADDICRTAYGWADAMLRQRGDHIADASKMVESPKETRANPASTQQAPRKLPRLLSGLQELINRNAAEAGSNTPDYVLADFLDDVRHAFDAAVRERERWHGRRNHDAAPAARATMPSEVQASAGVHGTGDTPMGAIGGDAGTDVAQSSHEDVNTSRSGVAPAIQPVTKPMTKEKRAEVSDGRPVAWGLPNADGDEIWATSLNKEAIEQHCPTNQTLVPLYRSPQSTLTDEEREAIVQAIGLADWHKAYFSHLKQGEPLPSSTLRGLLERLK